MTGRANSDKHADMLSFGRCWCGKVRFKTRKAAKRVIRRMSGQGRDGRLSTYPCDGWFHVGHQPGIVTRGEVDRHDFDPDHWRSRA